MKIGILLFNKKKDRGTRKNNSFIGLPYYGFKYILSELKYSYDMINLSQIKDYDFVLCSLSSIMDIENLIYAFEEYKPDKGNCKIIVGGFGCINIIAIYDYIDIAVFGRAENQINDIINGVEFDNVWRKDKDKFLDGVYNIRQTNSLLSIEKAIGCRNKCAFCQYTWTRKYIGNYNYDPVNAPFPEDDWRGLKVENSGRYLTGWDGLSEKTRFIVGKKITDENIKNKIISFYNIERKAAVNLKIYNIIGFPWETKETITRDIKKLNDLFMSCDRRIGDKNKRILIMMMFTPFSPEPLTPMELMKSNIDMIWGNFFREIGRNIYGDKNTDIECFILPQINSSFTLAKRVMINRCNLNIRKYIQNVLKNKKIDSMRAEEQILQLRKYDKLPYEIFNEIIDPPIKYLKTYVDYKHLIVDHEKIK